MGILGKIFDKKECDICGNDIGLFGNRKLEDGNCCKDCAKKLSPWMTADVMWNQSHQSYWQ